MESFADTEVQKIQFNSQELLAVLVASASILSLSGERYQDDAFREMCIPSDLLSLTFGVPLLFASAYEGYLIPGVSAYQMYSSLTYVLAFRASPGWVFFLHLIVLWMSANKFWETTEGGKILFGKPANKSENEEALETPNKYAGLILMIWGILVSLRASLRMELLASYFGNLSLTESAVDCTQLLMGVVWTTGGIQLFQYANAQLGLCLLLQLSAFIYGSLLILLIRYCIFENSDTKLEDALVLAMMAISVIVPLESFFSSASSSSVATAKVPKG